MNRPGPVSTTEHIRKLKHQFDADVSDAVTLRKGVVEAIQSNNRADVRVGFDVIPNIAALDHVALAVGAVVWLDKFQNSFIIIGSQSGVVPFVNKSGDTMDGTLTFPDGVGIDLRQNNGISASRIPNDWPMGMTTAQCTVGNGWPTNGPVMTLRQTDSNYGWQIQLAVGSVFMRRPIGGGEDWHPWIRLSDMDQQVVIGAGFSGFPALQLRRDNPSIHNWEIGPSSVHAGLPSNPSGGSLFFRRLNNPGNAALIIGPGGSNQNDHYVASQAGRLHVEGTELRSLGAANDTTGNSPTCFLATNGRFMRSTSSERYKRDIRPITDEEADRVLDIEPVRYRSECKGDRDDWSHYGFTAEQVATVDPRLVQHRMAEPSEDDDGSGVDSYETDDEGNLIPESVQYDRMVPHLVNVVKRQRNKISDLETKLVALTEKVEALT